MTNIYVEGGKQLGLGHLSRIVPLYHNLCERFKEINVYLFGDDVAVAYLTLNQVESVIMVTDSDDYDNNPESDYLWIVDSTDIHNKTLFSRISRASYRVLISPKFNDNKVTLFNYCILRSDPFNLDIRNKYVSTEYFTFNDGSFYTSGSKKTIGICLSGANVGKVLDDLITHLINDNLLSKYVSRIKVFMGSNTTLSFSRERIESYQIELLFISSLKSFWGYAEDIDLMIVGNGIVIDECKIQRKTFLIFLHDKENDTLKSSLDNNIENTIFFKPENAAALLIKAITEEKPDMEVISRSNRGRGLVSLILGILYQ